MADQPQGTHEHVDDEAFIIVKAAPRASRTYGETVCIAAVDRSGSWQRLYPVSFRYLDDAKKFGRWDRIKYRWRRPRVVADRRTESRRVDADSITIVGRLPDREHHSLINRLAVTSLKRERELDRSLAMLKCDQVEFRAARRSRDQMEAQRATYEHLRAQTDMFAEIARFVPREPSPFSFFYRYRDDEGWHDGECQDWETEATFMKRLHEGRSERESLDWMHKKFGEEFPRLGMALAMGTHRRRADQWLINGIIRYDPSAQQSLI